MIVVTEKKVSNFEFEWNKSIKSGINYTNDTTNDTAVTCILL